MKQNMLGIILLCLSASSVWCQPTKPRFTIYPPLHYNWNGSWSSGFDDDDRYLGSTRITDMLMCAIKTKYCATDLNTGKSVWTNKFKTRHEYALLAGDGDTLYLGVEKHILICNAQNGGNVRAIALPDGLVAMTVSNGYLQVLIKPGVLLVFDTRTLKRHWRLDLSDEFHVKVDEAKNYPVSLYSSNGLLFINISSGDLRCVDIKRKYIKWRRHLKKTGNDNSWYGLTVNGERLLVTSTAGRIAALSQKNGYILWEYNAGKPIRNNMVVLSNRIFMELENEFVGINKDGSEAWRKPVKNNDRINSPLIVDRDVVIRYYKYRIQAFDANGDMVWSNTFGWDPHGAISADQVTDIYILNRSLFINCGSWGYSYAMGKYNIPATKVPILLSAVKNGYVSGTNEAESACEKLGYSDDPSVVKLFSQLINDKDTSPGILITVCLGLARNGGESGAEKVLALRNKQRTIDSIETLFEGCQFTPEQLGGFDENSGIRLVSTEKDSKGNIWGLLVTGILGHYQDLWIARYQDKHWTDAAFTGEFSDKPEKTDWFNKYVNNKELYKDTDKDGWSDIIEQRLGTDPTKADSDGDGIKDSEDKNPLACPRQLTEDEKVLSAVFASSCLQNKRRIPLLINFPKGIEPFELMESRWVILPATKVSKEHLAKISGYGVGVTGFSLPRENFMGMLITRKQGDSPILYNDDHTEAIVKFGIADGYLSGYSHDIHLKKVKNGWVAIEFGRMAGA